MAITQKQVDDWFKQNPNATPEQVAKTVQSLGGLSANEGLAELIGNQYGRSAGNINAIYNRITDPDSQNELPSGGMSSVFSTQDEAPKFTQKQINDWFKANPNATPEEVAQTVQGLGGLEANRGLSNQLGNYYGMSGEGIKSIYDTLTYQSPGDEYKQNKITPITSLEQMKQNLDQWNRLEEYAKKNPGTVLNDTSDGRGLSESELTYSKLSRNAVADPELAKRFAQQYRLATSSQVRDPFSNKSTYWTDVIPKLIEKGVSPEAVARYTGVPVQQAMTIYKSYSDNDRNFADAVFNSELLGSKIPITPDTKYQRLEGGFVVYGDPNRAPQMYDYTGKSLGRYDFALPNTTVYSAAKNPYLSKPPPKTKKK